MEIRKWLVTHGMLLSVVLSETSCCSIMAIHAAEGRNSGGLLPHLEEGKERKPNPAYYLLLPLAVPADIVFMPIVVPLVHFAIMYGK